MTDKILLADLLEAERLAVQGKVVIGKKSPTPEITRLKGLGLIRAQIDAGEASGATRFWRVDLTERAHEALVNLRRGGR